MSQGIWGYVVVVSYVLSCALKSSKGLARPLSTNLDPGNWLSFVSTQSDCHVCLIWWCHYNVGSAMVQANHPLNNKMNHQTIIIWNGNYYYQVFWAFLLVSIPNLVTMSISLEPLTHLGTIIRGMQDTTHSFWVEYAGLSPRGKMQDTSTGNLQWCQHQT